MKLSDNRDYYLTQQHQIKFNKQNEKNLTEPVNLSTREHVYTFFSSLPCLSSGWGECGGEMTMGELLSDTTLEAVVALPSLQTLSWSTPHVHLRGLRLEGALSL